MRIYKPTIYRLAAEIVLTQKKFGCVALRLALQSLLYTNHETRVSRPLKDEYASFFKPAEVPAEHNWFGSIEFGEEPRILSLLLMAEITKGQYLKLPPA